MKRVLQKLFPFLRWWPLTRKDLRADFIAGLTVALVLIPQSMAYAQLAGLPPYYGLYAAFIPGIIGVMWGSSSHLATGPVAMTSLLTCATLMPFVDKVGSEEYIQLAVLLALLVGIVRLLTGILRLTFMVNFLSQPVIRGFTNAGALIIASSQVNKLLGVEMARSDFYLSDIFGVATRVGQAHIPTLLIGTVSIAVIFFLKKYRPRIPSALVVAVLGAVAAYSWSRFGADVDADRMMAGGISVVGNVPQGLPDFAPPRWDDRALQLIPGAVVVMFIGFMEVCSVTKAIAARSKEKVDLNQEMIGQGMSAVAGSFSQCYPTSGSFSRSAINYAAGGRTGVSSLFAGAFVLVTLLFLTDLLFFLPQAALAAIIIMAVAGLVDFKEMVQAWKVQKRDGIAALVTFAATLFFAPNMVNGILLGAGVALFLHMLHTMKPRIAVVGQHEDGTLRDAAFHQLEVDRAAPAVRIDGRLYFASTAYVESAVLNLLNQYPEARHILVLGSGINAIDASGVYTLRSLVEQLREGDVDLLFVGLKQQVIDALKRSGLYQVVGREHFFRTLADARAYLATKRNACCGENGQHP